MADGGYLAPPSEDPSKEKIWVETRKRLERFLPDLFAEIFPDKLETPPQAEAPATPDAGAATTAAVSPATDADTDTAAAPAAAPAAPASAPGEPQGGSAGGEEDDLD